MSADLILPIVFRWVHILSAVVAVGGTIFIRFVLTPAVKATLADEQHAALRERLMRRWHVVVMACITGLLVSGVYNFVTLSLPKAKGIPAYHPLFGVKFLAAMGVFFLASALTGRSPGFAPLRANARKWLAVNVALAVVVILLSGVLKNLKPVP